MKTLILPFVAAVLTLFVTASTQALETIDFAHEDAFKHPVLSPDGQTLAYSQTIKGEFLVFLLDLKTNEKVAVNLESSTKRISRSASYFWSTSKRFVCQYGDRYYTVDRDGRNGQANTPYGGLVHNFRDEKSGALLVNGYEVTVGTGLGRAVEAVVLPRPYVHRVNTIQATRIGSGLYDRGSTHVIRVVDNPGNVLEWVANADGHVLAGTEFKSDQFRVVYRSSEKLERWDSLPGLDWDDPDSKALGFSADGRTLYVSRVSPSGTWGLYPYNLTTKTLGEPAVVSDSYDVFQPFSSGGTNGVSQNTLIYSPKEERLLGVHYNLDTPRTAWMDSELAVVQASLDQTLPGKINTILTFSDNLQRMVLLSWSATDPGTYYLFDREKVSLEKLFSSRPWINPEEAAEVKRFKYKGRSGVELSGYATLPPGRKPSKMPTIVIAGGTNRSLWDYDGFSQFFASRGYMVLNLNHRGRLGLGEAFQRGQSKPVLFDAAQDIEDGVNWAIKVGLTDPQRVAIHGYGGVSGLLALLIAQERPAIFKCAFVNEPFVDLTKMVDRSRLNPWFYNQAVKAYGDPEKAEDLAGMRAASPALNGKNVTIPLLVQHKDDIWDGNWVYNLTKDWVATAGADVKFIHDYDEEFGYQTLAKYWQEDLEFITRHMPAE